MPALRRRKARRNALRLARALASLDERPRAARPPRRQAVQLSFQPR
jgi:hypothetical protein